MQRGDLDMPPGEPPLPGWSEQGCRGPLGPGARSETTLQAVTGWWGVLWGPGGVRVPTNSASTGAVELHHAKVREMGPQRCSR